MSKQTYWLTRADEPSALVEGAAERDQWVKVHGWAEASEPADDQQVHVVNEQTGGRGALPYGPVRDGLFAGLGWRIASPPAPVDLTKDPALVDQPVAAPVTPKTESAAPAATSKEK
jgi:hypothetical protein